MPSTRLLTDDASKKFATQPGVFRALDHHNLAAPWGRIRGNPIAFRYEEATMNRGGSNQCPTMKPFCP
jgi:hypothetical protein